VARLPLSPPSPLFVLNRAYQSAFFVLIGPGRLGTERAGFGQKNKPTGLEGLTRFSNRAWRAGPKPCRAQRVQAESGGPFGHLYMGVWDSFCLGPWG
jgi:hypothetical protein